MDSMHVGSIHMNLHKVDVHLIESTSRGGLVAHSSRMVLLFMNYAYHEIVCLVVGLTCGTCYIAPLCSALAAMLGKKEPFLWPRRVVQLGKIIIMMVLLCYNT